jgi:hypothetical protein
MPRSHGTARANTAHLTRFTREEQHGIRRGNTEIMPASQRLERLERRCQWPSHARYAEAITRRTLNIIVEARMLGGGISTYHPPDCSVTPSRLAPHTHSNSRPSRFFPFEDGALDYTVVPAGFPEAISLGAHVGSWSNSHYLGERSPCQAVQPVKERPHLSFTHALELASFFCTQALHGRV